MIYQWNQIAESFTDTLIIGNGASREIERNFKYSSLLAVAVRQGFINAQTNAIFESLRDCDFESILSQLNTAHAINEAIEVVEQETKKHHKAVRDALILTINYIHPDRSAIVPHLDRIESFLHRFNRIYTLNYDLFLYWAILYGNDKRGPYTYKDCFINGKFDPLRMATLREPYNGNEKAILTFYLHGSLMLTTNAMGQTVKLRCVDNSLIKSITDAWVNEGKTPLFISEGSHDRKLCSIRSNHYLSYIYENELRSKKESICIYGMSLLPTDRHILDALAASKPTKIAISVNKSGTPEAQRWMLSVRHALEAIDKPPQEIYFFDSHSPNAWTH